MFRRIIQFTLLAFLAWFLRPVLEVILPIPTKEMVEGVLNFEKDSHITLFKLLRGLVWIIFLAIVFKYSRPLFSFILPTARRFSGSKPLRRVQGLFAGVLIAFLIFFFVGTVISSFLAYHKQKDSYEDNLYTVVQESIKSWNDYNKEVDNLLVKNRSDAKTYISSLTSKHPKRSYKAMYVTEYYVPKGIWPYQSTEFVSQSGLKELDTYLLNSDNYGKWVTPWLSLSHTRSDYLYRRKKESRFSFQVWQKDIRCDPKYKEFYALQLAHQYKKSNAGAMITQLTTEDPSEELEAKAKEKTKAEIGSAFAVYKSTFASKLWIITLISLPLFIGFYYGNRKGLSEPIEGLLNFLEQGRFGMGGSARFAGLFEEWSVLYKNQKEGLFMGRSLYNPFLNIGLEDSRHMLTIAGSRAGKGATSIIPNLLLWEGSVLVIDPKGTNAHVTARRREELGQKVHLIDPFNVVNKEGKTASFNPLKHLNPDSPTIREEINMITEAIVVPDENQKEKHWDDGAKTIISGLIGHLVSTPKYENPSLVDLRDLLSDLPENQIELWADMSVNDGAGRLAKDAANRVLRGIGTDEISSIISNADKQTEWLSSPAIQNAIKTSSFEFSEMKESPTTIYLILPPELLETHNRFLRLFVNLAISQMSIGGRSKVPTLLLMDEFLALGKMEEVEKAYGLMAGYNLILWPYVQDLGRLKKLYGDSVNSFIANSRGIQVFGVADEETKEFVSKYIGEHNLSRLSKGKANGLVRLRSPSEVASDIAIHTNRQYILRAGKAPLILEKVPYYNSIPLGLDDVKIGEKSLGIFDGLYEPDPDYQKV